MKVGKNSKVLAFDGTPGTRRRSVPMTDGIVAWRDLPCEKSLGWLIEHNQMATYAANQLINITRAGLGVAYFDPCGSAMTALDEVFAHYPHDKELSDRLEGDLART